MKAKIQSLYLPASLSKKYSIPPSLSKNFIGFSFCQIQNDEGIFLCKKKLAKFAEVDSNFIFGISRKEV